MKLLEIWDDDFEKAKRTAASRGRLTERKAVVRFLRTMPKKLLVWSHKNKNATLAKIAKELELPCKEVSYDISEGRHRQKCFWGKGFVPRKVPRKQHAKK
jgi:hypothetical protein